MRQYWWKIFRYELYNLLRSKWLIAFAALFFFVTQILLYFGQDTGKIAVSLMNVILLIVPLVGLVLGLVYFYHSREFVELLLSQPITRAGIFFGKFLGLWFSVSLALTAGVGLPLLFQYWRKKIFLSNFFTLLGVGIVLIFIFVAIAFLVASIYEDKIKGFGAVLIVWLFLTIFYDAGLLLLIHVFQDYPLEKPLLAAIALNPVDLGRILVLLQLDIAALMGYTGALFRKIFGSGLGQAMTLVSLLLWMLTPLGLGFWHFQRKDF